MTEIVIGENKTNMNFVNNLYEDKKVIACAIFKEEDKPLVSLKELNLNQYELDEAILEQIKNSDVTIKFSSKEAVNLVIDKLIKIRDNTDWEWRE